MLILSLDTASEWGGAAVFDDEREVAVVLSDGSTDRYSITLFEMTHRALAMAGIALRDVDLFAATNGPGSFTGIRIELAAVQAWSDSFKKPAIGVSVLEAMVESASPTTAWAAPISDARKNEFYMGRFHPASVALVKDGGADEEWLIGAADIEDHLRRLHDAHSSDLCCIVREGDAKAQALRQKLEEDGLVWKSVPNSILRGVANIALRRVRSYPQEGSAGLDARYIRRPDAELNWRES